MKLIHALVSVGVVLGVGCSGGGGGGGGGSIAPPLSALDPLTAPAYGELTYTLDPTITLAPASYPLRVATPLGIADLSPAGTPVLSYLPTATNIAFLVSGSGETIAPFAIRPSDLATGEVVLTIDRMALGIVAIHPWLSEVSSEVREQFFDMAPGHPNFAFLVAHLAAQLADAPEEVGDPQASPETFAGLHPLVTDVLASLLPPPPPPLPGPLSTPCGEVESKATFSVQAGASGNIVLVNPRAVFYGIEVDPASAGPSFFGLARPKKGFIDLFKLGVQEPETECFPLQEGSSTITAQAYLLTTDLFAATDLFTAGGRGNVANSFYLLFLLMDVAVHFPLPTKEMTALMVSFLDLLVGSGGGPGFPSIFEGLFEILEGSIDDIITELAEWAANNWDDISKWIWASWPSGVEKPTEEFMEGLGQFLGGFLKTLTSALELQDVAAFGLDTVLTIGEGPLASCATNTAGTVMIDCPEPFGILPAFEYSPTTASVGEPVLFDPAATSFVGAAPGSAVYEWFLEDFDGSTLPDMTTFAPVPVEHAFDQPGFHGATLRVTVGTVAAHAYANVPVSFLPNLGFEDGTTAGWTVETHTWSVTDPGSVEPGHSAIVTPGLDPIATGLTNVWNGNYALRVEDAGSGCFVSSGSRSFVVPTGTFSLKFAWAAVLEDPGHLPSEQPYFDIRVHDETSGNDIYLIHHYSGEPGYPWQSATSGSSLWNYVPWQPVTLDLSGLTGHTLVVSAIGADCGLCGHGGYVYLDAVEGQ